MKKIMILLALVAGMQLANAQKSPDSFKKAFAAAKEACNDAKKASKPATWLTFAKASLDAYSAPQLNGMVGANRQELQVIMGSVRPLSTTNETVGGTAYIVDHFQPCDFYYSQDMTLQMIIVTNPYVEGALEAAAEAYAKAAQVDPSGSKTKDIVAGLEKVAQNYQSEAINYYNLGDFAKSSENFKKAADVLATAPCNRVDAELIYNSGFTALSAGNYESAKASFEKCIELNHLSDGDVYAKLSECHRQLGNAAESKSALEEGFSKCPNNQAILIGLINLYLETNDDPEKLFSLLDIAKKNEPNNASLFYVEGNIRKQLGQIDEALAAYAKCAEVNPSYEYGFVGAGLLHVEESDKIAAEAEKEFDDAKYAKLVEKFEAHLEAAIEPFEKAFEIASDNGVKTGVAEYLKNIYFRFRTKSDAHQAAYEKYKAFVEEN